MSGLCSGRRWLCPVFLRPPLSPRMGSFGRGWAVGARQGFGLRHQARPGRDYVKGERSSVVREPYCPIEPMFDLHVRGPDGVMNLIEHPLLGNREILP